MRWLFGLGRRNTQEEQAQEPEEQIEEVIAEPEPEEAKVEAEPDPEPNPEIEGETEPEVQIELEVEPEADPETEAKAEHEIALGSTHKHNPPTPSQAGWFGRLRQGLSKSSSRLSSGIGAIFTKRKLDDDTLEELEELLISADLGVATAAEVTANLAKSRFGKEVEEAEIKQALADEIAKLLDPVAVPFGVRDQSPHTVLFVGANGSGKTTTIGKFAKDLTEKGAAVTLAAGDTFRAAAVQQLKIWGERTGAPVVARDAGADPAGLAFDALTQAREAGSDLLLVDTAGRLHNRAELMDELAKVVRVLKKRDETAPQDVILVLDATIGQNALQQVKVFLKAVQVTGLVVTKLDGTAKGGVIVALAKEFGLPIHAIGVGESAEDLRPFDAQAFARALVGLE